jgi:O-antigen/teichoic acid export membrane protein
MGVTFIYGSDNLIIAQFLGPEAVTQYAVPYQLFSLVFVISNMYIGPLWPAYAEALTRGDINWVKNTFSRSLKLIMLSTGIISIVFIIFGNQILYLWVGSAISPSFLLNLGLGIWMIVFSIGAAMSQLLNAANIFRFQIIFIFLTLIFSLLFKCILVNHLELAGIVWGAILAYIMFFIIPYRLYIINYFFE